MTTLFPFLLIELAARHDRGEHSVACDYEVSERFGYKVTGLSGKIWHTRCYLRGFLRP